MKGTVHRYTVAIKETNLDLYGHVNNATYLTLFEDARWDLINSNGYGFVKILETGLGPVVLEVTVRYLKELRLREEIVIETCIVSYERKVGKMVQKMMRGKEVCCEALFTFGLFDTKERKLVMPTVDWLKGVGLDVEANPTKSH